MRLIDLTVLLDPANREKLPPALQHAAGVVAPRIDYNNPAEQAGKDEFCLSLGCRGFYYLSVFLWGFQ